MAVQARGLADKGPDQTTIARRQVKTRPWRRDSANTDSRACSGPRAADIDALFEPRWREQLLAQALKELEMEVSASQYQAFHVLTVQRSFLDRISPPERDAGK